LNSSIAINEKQSIIPHDLSGRLLKSEKAFLNLSAESGTIVVKGSFWISSIMLMASGLCDGRHKLFATSIKISYVVRNGP